MVFGYDPKPPYNRKKGGSRLLSPKSLGVFFVIIAMVLMIYSTSDQSSSSSLPFSRVVNIPMSLLQKGKNMVDGWINFFVGNFKAQKELSELKDKLALYEKEILELRYKLRKHEGFVEALQFSKEESEFPSVVAVVTGRDNRLTKSLIINRGKKDGVDINMMVCSGQAVVGRTIQVTTHFAKVQPLTDPGSAIGVQIEGTSYEAVLRGTDQGDSLILTDEHLVFPGDEMRKPDSGMRVFTSGTGMVYPENILAGTITDATFQGNLVVEPALNYDAVQAVRVITKTSFKEEMLSLLTEQE